MHSAPLVTSHPVPARPATPPAPPGRPSLDPKPAAARARGPSVLYLLDVGGLVSRPHGGPSSGPLSPGLDAARRVPPELGTRPELSPVKGSGPWAEALLQRASQPVRLEERLLSAYWGGGAGGFSCRALEAFSLTQGRRQNCCYKQGFFPPQPMQTSLAPQNLPLSLDPSPYQTWSSPRPTAAHPAPLEFFPVTPRSLD